MEKKTIYFGIKDKQKVEYVYYYGNAAVLPIISKISSTRLTSSHLIFQEEFLHRMARIWTYWTIAWIWMVSSWVKYKYAHEKNNF